MSRIRSFDQRTFKARTFLPIWGNEDEFSAAASAEISATAAAVGVVGVSGTAAAVVASRADAAGTIPSSATEPVQIVLIGGGSPLLSRKRRKKKQPIVAVEGAVAATVSIETRGRGIVGAPPAITGTAKAGVIVVAQMDGNFTNMIPWDNDDLMMLAA